MLAGQSAVDGYIGRWRSLSVSGEAAAFARDVVASMGPLERERARNLLQSAGKLADYGTGLGLEAVPEVLLHPSTAERFTRSAPGLSGAARRTLRTNLRFIGVLDRHERTRLARAARAPRPPGHPVTREPRGRGVHLGARGPRPRRQGPGCQLVPAAAAR